MYHKNRRDMYYNYDDAYQAITSQYDEIETKNQRIVQIKLNQ